MPRFGGGRQPIPRAADGVGEQQLQLDQPCADDRRVEPPVLHRGAGRFQRSRTRSITTSTCSANAHTRDNRFGGIYSFNYDVRRSTMLQRGCRRSTTRSAAASRSSSSGTTSRRAVFIVPSDHRFFLSFTLAGLGNFSPFNGAMSGVPDASARWTVRARHRRRRRSPAGHLLDRLRRRPR